MEKIKAWVKAHPKLAIALTLGIVVLFYLLTRGSSSSSASSQSTVDGLSSSDYASIQEAELQAGIQQQQLTAQQNAQQSQLQAQLDAEQVQYQSADTVANDELQASLAQTAAAGTAAGQQTAAQTTVAGDETQLGALQSDNQTAVQLASISAQTQALQTQSSVSQDLVSVIQALTGSTPLSGSAPASATPPATTTPTVTSSAPTPIVTPPVGGTTPVTSVPISTPVVEPMDTSPAGSSEPASNIWEPEYLSDNGQLTQTIAQYVEGLSPSQLQQQASAEAPGGVTVANATPLPGIFGGTTIPYVSPSVLGSIASSGDTAIPGEAIA